MNVHVVGGGLAGSEAAYFLAQHCDEQVRIFLHEMRPNKMTEAHHTGGFAELVCSNSLKSKQVNSAPGMLKAEMSHVGSLILEKALAAEVPSGESLGVDRTVFSDLISQALRQHPKITVVPGEVDRPFEALGPDGKNTSITLFATGPLTSETLTDWIFKATSESADGQGYSGYFYDAIAPIIDASTIDMDSAFAANRYDKGDEVAYLNCPMNESEYNAFIDALASAEKVPPKNFEKEKFFQGCQPIEAIAQSGRETLRFGPMKPVGLDDPKTGRRPHAVVQLRPENRAKTAYNLVGFQTKLKYGEQSRVFRMIPALKKAEFLRLGSIHRNTYVCAPKVLRQDLSLKKNPLVYLAGQITGVEGYLESAACGLLAGIFILQRLKGMPHSAPPASTALGSLLRHVTGGDGNNYQPSNIHFGLFDPIYFDGLQALKRDQLRERMKEQALKNFHNWWQENGMAQ